MAELRTAEPELMAELDLVRARLERAISPEGRFSNIREVREGAEILLQENPDGITKDEIAAQLLAGGYYNGKPMRENMIQNALGYHIKKGRFIRKDDGRLVLAADK
ncbi:MAG TPA: hypothetical protein VGG18_16315 [Granulicella sp.]